MPLLSDTWSSRGKREMLRPTQQVWFAKSLYPLCKRRTRTAPAQLLHIFKERYFRSQRCQLLERQRGLAIVAEDLRRESLDATVLIDQPGSALRADSTQAGIPIRCISDEGQIIGNMQRIHTILSPDRG